MQNLHHGCHPFTGRASGTSFASSPRPSVERRHTDFPLHPDRFSYRSYAGSFFGGGRPYWRRAASIHILNDDFNAHDAHREYWNGAAYVPTDWSRTGRFIFPDPYNQGYQPTYNSKPDSQFPRWLSTSFLDHREQTWEGNPWERYQTNSSTPQSNPGAADRVPSPPFNVDMNSQGLHEGDDTSSISSSCQSGCDFRVSGFGDSQEHVESFNKAPGIRSDNGDLDEVATSSDSSQSTHATFVQEPSFPTMRPAGHEGYDPPRASGRQSVHDFFGGQVRPEAHLGSQPFVGGSFRGEFPPMYTSPPRFKRNCHESRHSNGPQQPQPCPCSCYHDADGTYRGTGTFPKDEVIAAKLEELQARESHIQEVEAALEHTEEALHHEQERMMHASAMLRSEKAEFEEHRNQFWREWRRQQEQSLRQPACHFTDSDFDMLSSDDEEMYAGRGPPFFGWNGFPAQDTSPVEAQEALEEHNKHWDQLDGGDAAIRYPTPSGEGGDLLDVRSGYMQQITASNRYERAPKLPNSGLPIHPHQVVRYNVLGFFISAFGVRLRYVAVDGLENGSSPQWRPDFRGANQEALKKLRDHLRRKEQRRWHPDQMNRRRNGAAGDEEIFVKGEVSMSGRELREAVHLAITDLRQEDVEKTLRGET